MEDWFCVSLFELFKAKAHEGEDYVACQYGIIEQTDNNFYDFCTEGKKYLCCDGEQCKLIKVEGNVLTLFSNGNSYEENVEDFYFKLTKEEARIAGINI